MGTTTVWEIRSGEVRPYRIAHKRYELTRQFAGYASFLAASFAKITFVVFLDLLTTSKQTANTIMAPSMMDWICALTPSKFMTFSKKPMMNAPATVPLTVPIPPEKEVPPTIAAVRPVIS